MKCIILVLLASVALTRAIANDEVLQKWSDFQAKFGKIYKSPVESRERLSIFKKNLETIKNHNTLFEQGKVSYTLGINHFADWTSGEFMQYVGKGLISRPKSGSRSHIFKASENLTLPESVDWRKEGIVTGVKDQGQCGGCWAFSTILLMRFVMRSSSFQDSFAKVYMSSADVEERFNIFRENLKKIETHNTLFHEGKVSYALGVNKFTDWTSEEFKQYVNEGPVKKPESVGLKRRFNSLKNFELPESVDWRKEGLVTNVKDQGACKSSWSFSVTGAVEGQFARKNGTLVSLSEQNLIDCSSNFGCSSGDISLAYWFLMWSGIESERDYPFEGVKDICRAEADKTRTRIFLYQNIAENNEVVFVDALASEGPISVIVDATENLQLYSSGIFDDINCSSNDVNHPVLAVGYGKENGKEYYIIKNSWGVNWGEEGYFRLLKNKNRCGIANSASYPYLL